MGARDDERAAATKAELAALRELRDASARRARAACLVEGERALLAALQAGAVPTLLAVEDGLADAPVVARAASAGARVIVAPAERLARSSDRRAAPGLLAEVPIPDAWAPAPVAGESRDLVVGLCGLQDPGNVGTLVRSARAFGARALVCTSGTADPWGPKVVRATAGAVFGLPVGRVDGDDEWIPLGARLGLDVVAASAHGEPDATDLPARCLLLLGHETRGVPPGVGRPVTIRHEPGVESLNVAMAGSILMARWYDAAAAS